MTLRSNMVRGEDVRSIAVILRVLQLDKSEQYVPFQNRTHFFGVKLLGISVESSERNKDSAANAARSMKRALDLDMLRSTEENHIRQWLNTRMW